MVFQRPRESRLNPPIPQDHPWGSHPSQGQGRGWRGHAGCSIYAAVGGRPLYVGETQGLWIHRVSGTEMFLVAAAGSIAGEGVVTGVAGAMTVAALLTGLED